MLGFISNSGVLIDFYSEFILFYYSIPCILNVGWRGRPTGCLYLTVFVDDRQPGDVHYIVMGAVRNDH